MSSLWPFPKYSLKTLEDDLVETRRDLKAVYQHLNQVLSEVLDIKKNKLGGKIREESMRMQKFLQIMVTTMFHIGTNKMMEMLLRESQHLLNLILTLRTTCGECF